MKYLFARWNDVTIDIADKFVMLFLDYDGTLTPIVESPDKAHIPEQTRDLLKKLSANPLCTIAIITGRATKDIKGKIGIRNIIYASNHGLQVQGPNIKFKTPLSASYRNSLRKIKSQLHKKLSFIKGILLEDKGPVLSLHYRLVAEQQIPPVKNTFRQIVTPFIACNEIQIKSGKKVFEVMPSVKWDKGKVVLWILNKHNSALCDKSVIPIYIGDDVTDEDAFKMLKNKGLTIFVGGPRRSFAKYYLKNTREVLEFLKRLNRLLTVNSLSTTGWEGQSPIKD